MGLFRMLTGAIGVNRSLCLFNVRIGQVLVNFVPYIYIYMSVFNGMLWFVYSMFMFKYITNDNELNASNFSVFLTGELSRAEEKEYVIYPSCF